jgi:hypothetical protein
MTRVLPSSPVSCRWWSPAPVRTPRAYRPTCRVGKASSTECQAAYPVAWCPTLILVDDRWRRQALWRRSDGGSHRAGRADSGHELPLIPVAVFAQSSKRSGFRRRCVLQLKRCHAHRGVEGDATIVRLGWRSRESARAFATAGPRTGAASPAFEQTSGPASAASQTCAPSSSSSTSALCEPA